MNNLEDIKKKFNDKGLFEQALTHRSWINENPGIRSMNERLEFLGDAVLEYIVSKELYNRLPDKEEGFLTALRANIVNTRNLATLATLMGIGDAIYLSKGEDAGGGRKNSSLLADTVEAILGAVYLDQGIDAAEQFVLENLLSDLDKKLLEPLKDPKSRLQERVQADGYPTPKYDVVGQEGPDHSKSFTVAVIVGHHKLATGKGPSKSLAEQQAAENALEKIEAKGYNT